jgi:adenine-specific DNA-methyltransferase
MEFSERTSLQAVNRERRRQLRRAATPAERVLWHLLRDRRLGGYKGRRQHQRGPYILDFYFPDQRLALEADGEHHTTADGYAYDAARTAYLAARGIRVLRFTNHEILSERERVLALILAALASPDGPATLPPTRPLER